MMPPKKSKAARSAHQEETPEAPKPEEVKKEEKEEQEQEVLPPAGDDENDDDVNIFKVEIVDGKRARSLPAGEQSLKEWVELHLEDKSEFEMVLGDAYDNYVSSCVSTGAFAATQYEFMKLVKEKFPSGASVKKSSPFKGLIREKKPKRERTEKEKAATVKAQTFKLKIKDIVTTAIEDLGNPNNGVKFYKLKNHIAGKHPALKMDERPKLLLSYLEKSVQHGVLEQVKGVGMCGHFRLFGESDEDKENKKVKSEEEATGDENETEKKPEEGEDKKEEGQEGEVKDEEDKTEEDKPKTRKRKAPAKGKGKSKGNKKESSWKKYRSFVVHSDPERIEDSFSLAMTFMVEPKETSAKKILTYVNDYYDRDLSKEKLRLCLETGCDKGYWEQVTGQGFSGSFRLLMDEFDPTADDDLVGKVTNALVACTEPKQCSARLLKEYMLEYHKEKFDITNKSYLFKRSLERGINKDIIRQLSGIGASGSYQLAEVFTPTPVILRGEDNESDYASNTEPESDYDDQQAEEPQGHGPFHISTFQDAYKPRPTKRHGHGRVTQSGDGSMTSRVSKKGRLIRTAKPAQTQPASKKTKPKKRSVYREQSSSEDEAPVRKQKKGGRASSRKTGRRTYREVEEQSESEDADSEEEPPAPTSRRATPAKGRGKPRNRQPSSNEEDVDSEEEAPPPKKSRTPAKKTPQKAPVKKTPAKKSHKKVMTKKAPVSSEDESEEEAPVVSKRGGRGTPSRNAAPIKSQKVSSDEEDEDSEPEPQAKSKKGASKSHKKVTPKKSKKAVSSSEDEDSEAFTPMPPPKKGKISPKKAEPKKSRVYSSDEQTDEEIMPVKKDRSTPNKAQSATPAAKKGKAKKGKGRRK